MEIIGATRLPALLTAEMLATTSIPQNLLINIIEKLIKRKNCTELRLTHMDGRFETQRLMGKTLLTAKDVPSNFLNTPSAHMLKVLTGKDTVTVEHKGSNATADVCCAFTAIMEWLQYGEGLRVDHMPTQFGALDLEAYWNEDRFTVTIGGDARPPAGYRLCWPLTGLPDRVTLNGAAWQDFDEVSCTIPHDFRGTVEATLPYLAPWPREP